MSYYPFTVKILQSFDEFDAHAKKWNDLWDRSTNSNPTARSETLSLFCKSKNQKQNFYAVIVQNDLTERWVAAIPLIEEVRKKVIRCAVGPKLISACLLVEPGDSSFKAMHLLIQELRRSGKFHWICAESVRLDSFEWNLFRQVLQEHNISHIAKKTHDTAIIPLAGEFKELSENWNTKKIREIKKKLQKLSTQGTVDFVEIFLKDEVLQFLPICFEIENSGWKGSDDERGLSIIKRNQVEYFTQNASLLADIHSMVLFGLVVNNKWIAFIYAFYGKNVIFSNKISYVSEYKKYAPGFVLRQLLIEYLISSRKDIHYFDCCGEFNEFQSYWKPKMDSVGYIVMPTSNLFGILTFKTYCFLKNIFK